MESCVAVGLPFWATRMGEEEATALAVNERGAATPAENEGSETRSMEAAGKRRKVKF